jgi:hypothetical protein
VDSKLNLFTHVDIDNESMSTFFSKRVFSLSFLLFDKFGKKVRDKEIYFFIFLNFFVSAFLVELIKDKKPSEKTFLLKTFTLTMTSFTK